MAYHCLGVRSNHLAEYCLAVMESQGSMLPVHRVAITVGRAGAHQCPVTAEEGAKKLELQSAKGMHLPPSLTLSILPGEA